MSPTRDNQSLPEVVKSTSKQGNVSHKGHLRSLDLLQKLALQEYQTAAWCFRRHWISQ